MKRTIAIQNPCELRVKLGQLQVRRSGELVGQIPLEDIGVLVLEERQIMMSSAVLSSAAEYNVAVICCNTTFHPNGLLLPLEGHHLQRRLFEAQLKASEPLKKQLWKVIVVAKLRNQARVLAASNKPDAYLLELCKKVKSGDSDNCEGTGAAYYWRKLFDTPLQRERGGNGRNALLNYGYAILRAMTARALVSAGLLPTWGVQHRNQYNAYCLADDVMETFRPMVDQKVVEMTRERIPETLETEEKKVFWSMAAWDLQCSGELRPLEHALAETASSLQQSFVKKEVLIKLPDVVP